MSSTFRKIVDFRCLEFKQQKSFAEFMPPYVTEIFFFIFPNNALREKGECGKEENPFSLSFFGKGEDGG